MTIVHWISVGLCPEPVCLPNLLLQSGADNAVLAASNVAAVAAAAGSLNNGPSMTHLKRLAAANSLASSADSFVGRGVSATGNPSVSSDGSGSPAQQEALQQIRAAMAALAQLNEAAFEAQQLLGMAAEGNEAQGVIREEGAAGDISNMALQDLEGRASGDGALSPFQQASAQPGAPAAGRLSRLSTPDLDSRSSMLSAGSGAGGASGPRRRVSVDSGSLIDSFDGSSRMGGAAAAARAAARRGRMSVDLVFNSSGEVCFRQRCPNLVQCEKEQLAAIARQQQQQ